MIKAWGDLSLAIVVFVTTCAGLGCLAGVWARGRAWTRQACILMSAAIAIIWPAVIVGSAFYGAFTYQRLDANDPGDAPAYVLLGSMLAGAVLFILGLPLALVGIYFARRNATLSSNANSRR